MRLKRLIANRLNGRSPNRLKVKLVKGIALVLLAVLTVTSVLILPTKQLTGIEPLSSRSSTLTPQVDRGAQLTIEGQKLYEAGEFSEAVGAWQKAVAAYTQSRNQGGVTQSRINISQALQALGFYPRACNTLLQAFNIADTDCQKLAQANEDYQQKQEAVLKTLAQIPNTQTKATGLRSLGDVLQKLDNLDLATKVLQLSSEVAKELHSPQDESAALLSLGNTYQAWGNRARVTHTIGEVNATPWHCAYSPNLGASKKFYQQAGSFYQQAANSSVAPEIWVLSEVNRMGVLLKANALSDAEKLRKQIQQKLEQLPASQTTIYARLNLASSLSCLNQANTNDAPLWAEIAQILATAEKQSRSLGDRRSQSYAFGYLGGLYAQAQNQSSQNLAYAQDLTKQALVIAQAINASDIAYQWQWQLGYLLKTQGDTPGAIAAYTQAVDTLQSLRSDLTASSANVQFSFQENVEPIYRQLVDLLLQSNEQKNLSQARDVVEALQIAQLENLLRCRLQTESPVAIDSATDPTTAVIYPIILADRIEVIVSLANQPLRHYSSALPQEQNIENLLQTMRQNMQAPVGAGPGFRKLSQQVYSWLLKPLEAELENSGVKTLVFVLDGALRQIPMAALHDGQHYLIEKYAVALSPSLQLIQPKPLLDNHLKVLAAGISQKIPGYSASALPEVKDELEQISQISTSVVLLNQQFTRYALANKINESPFSVVHLASHGQFSSNPEQTYIRAWDDSINVNQLRNLLQTRESRQASAIELLVLSACDTASGDRRSALGLAGVAVRAGARSTLASLWQVNDNSTAELMTDFYQKLSQHSDRTITKAKALQEAQINLLHRYKAPYYWAAYVLVGNWL